MHTVHPRSGGATLAGRTPREDELRPPRAWLDEPAAPYLSARLAISAVLTAQLLLVILAGGRAHARWLEVALATPVVLWGGRPSFERAAASFRRRRPSMFALVSLGTATAWAYGLAVTLAPRPSVAPHAYLGGAACTVTLVLAFEALERFARRRTVQAIADEVTVSRMLAARATHSEELAGRICRALVPGVLVIAAGTLAGWLAFGPTPTLPHAIASAASVFVIASPAAISLAAPMSFLMAAAAAKREGIALRDAESTETLSDVTTIVLDRTGVLTEGRPQVTTIEPAAGVEHAALVRIVATAEAESEHPLARAVVAHARPFGASDEEASPQSIRRPVRGRGVIAHVSGRSVVLGTSALLSARGIVVPEHALHRAEALRSDGATVSFVGVDGAYAGLVALGDSARGDAREAVAELRRMGVRVVMMTGAARTSGRHVARELDLHEAEVFAQVHPDDRARVIARLADRGEVVAVASTGRHARAASAGHIAIALGGDADAHVVLADGDLYGVVRAIRLARRTTRNVRQNLAVAFAYNLVAIPLAAGAWYAATGRALSPMLAAAAMGLGTLTVIGSSLRLLFRPRQ